jgi:aryl-alcohol dehydrogenase-like predicted oxidoreductase
MHYRTLGRTGWQVSEIGFGAWGLGGDWGPVDDEASVETLLHAFDRGINFVDTALAYGQGRSHRVIARALREWRGDKIYVATKIWPVRWPSPWDNAPAMRGRYPLWYVREEVEKCLRQLEVERLDLLQLHCWVDAGTEELDWLESLNALRLEGRIDRVGVSLRDNRPEEGVALARLGLVDSQQVVFNLFDQRPADLLFRAGERTRTAFVARVPFDSSALIGDWDENAYERWAEGDMRRNYFRGARFGETLRRVHALQEVCRPYYPTLAEAAEGGRS